MVPAFFRKRLLKEQVKQRKQEAEEKFKSGGSMKDAIRQSEIGSSHTIRIIYVLGR